MRTHPPIVCTPDRKSIDFHTKSYSYRFNCPTCGKSRRYNTNFLGNRYDLVCDGETIKRHKRGEPFESVVIVGSTATESVVTEHPAALTSHEREG